MKRHASSLCTVGVSLLVGTLATRRAHADPPTVLPREPLQSEPVSVPLTLTAGGFRFQASGYLQAQYEHHDESEDQLSSDGTRLLNQDRFLVRRGRLVLNAEREWAQALIELDGNTTHGPQFGIRLAEATLRYPSNPAPGTEPLIALTLGLFRTPFGYEIPQSNRDRVWAENSTVSEAFFPGESDAGVRLRGGLGWFRYAFALVNGEPIDTPTLGAQAPIAPRDVLGRLGVDVAGRSVRFTAGVSGLTGSGFHAGAAATKDSLVVHNPSESGAITTGSLQLVPGRAATASQTFVHWATGLDMEINARIGWALMLSVYGEVYFGQNMDRAVFPADPVTTGFDLREFGAVVGVTTRIRDLALLGLRVDYYDPDADAVAHQAAQFVHVSRDQWTASFLAGIQLPRSQTRLIAQYDSIRDHNVLGIDGLSHDLANNRLTVRLQVAF